MTAQTFGKRKTTVVEFPTVKSVGKTVPFGRSVVSKPVPAEAKAVVPQLSHSSAREAPPSLGESTVSAPSTWRIAFGAQAPSLQADELQDLATFFGAKADRFLKIYEKMRSRRGWIRGNSAAAALGFVWFFYRKMYLTGALLIVVPIVLAYVLPIGDIGGGVGSSVLTGMYADRAYLAHAINRIRKARELDLHGEGRVAYLRHAGGASLPAGIVAGLIYAGMIALAFVK